jgi:hypothetical protein
MLQYGRVTFGTMEAVMFSGRWRKSRRAGPSAFPAREIACGSSAAIYNHELYQL